MSSDWICAGLPVRKKVANTKAFVQKRALKNWKVSDCFAAADSKPITYLLMVYVGE